MDNKKARERQYLEEVARIFPSFPAGKIFEFESPDFIIIENTKTIGMETIGMEIVDYVRGQDKGESIDRRKEILRKKLSNSAKVQFESINNIPLRTHFHWNDRYLFRQSEIQKLAYEIVGLVESHIPQELFASIHIGADELVGTLLENVVHSFTITKVRNEKQSSWYPISSGWIEVQPDEIQYLIDSKNNKIGEYLKNCDTIWLIIVADGLYISSNIDLPEATRNNVYTGSFEKVLIYDRININVLSLRLQPIQPV